jgi:glycosyltransferase involved in cell wall biosynthesis
LRITLITGGAPHYEAGLIAGLARQNVEVEVVGGEDLAKAPELQSSHVRFRNFYGKNQPGRSSGGKLLRVIAVYLRLFAHAATSNSRLIHIQWPYKFVILDRTILNLYYKLLGKKLVFTAHNVDGDARDGTSTWGRHASLCFMYRIVDHVIVHTDKMKSELADRFHVPAKKVSVIPHGIMSAVPETAMTRTEARRQLGLMDNQRVILFFGLITPYKGLDILIEASASLHRKGMRFTLIIAGRIKECHNYWEQLRLLIVKTGLEGKIITHLRHIPDESVEVYLKAADVMVLPYRSIFQSGALFLSYRFGLPVIATDVGSFKEDIIQGETGFICQPADSADLAKTIEGYFASPLYATLEKRRKDIQDYASARYSWEKIGKQTRKVYEQVARE